VRDLSKLTLLPKMVTISGDTGSAPLFRSKLIRDCTHNGSIWSQKGSSDSRYDAKSDANCVRSDANRTYDGVKRHLTYPSRKQKDFSGTQYSDRSGDVCIF